MSQAQMKKPSFALSMGVLAALVIMMIVGFGIMRITLQSLLFLVIVVVALISVFAGYKWQQIQDAMVTGLMRGVIAMTIMFLIGSAAVIFYGLSTLTNGILQGIDHMQIPVRNAVIALASHLVVLVVLVQFAGIHIYGAVISYMFFAFLMCILNGLAIRKYLHYRQEVKRTFLIPGVASLIMALAVWLLYTPLENLMGNKPATLLCLVMAVLIYGFFVLFLRGITEEEMRAFPKGYLLVKVLKKIRLM